MTPADLKSARLRLGLTQTDFARLLGYGGKSRIAELEAGTRTPGGAVVRLVRAYLAGYRSQDWPKAEAPDGGSAPRNATLPSSLVTADGLVHLPATAEAVRLVRAAVRNGARRPGEIARRTRLGLMTVKEAIRHIDEEDRIKGRRDGPLGGIVVKRRF